MNKLFNSFSKPTSTSTSTSLTNTRRRGPSAKLEDSISSINSSSKFLNTKDPRSDSTDSEMGCIPSKESTSTRSGSGAETIRNERSRNREIEESIRQEKIALRSEAKMLLLGAGESGKSTMLKQMRLAYRDPFTTLERITYKEVVNSNVIQSMQAVIKAFSTLAITIPVDLMEFAELISEIDLDDDLQTSGTLERSVSKAIAKLWEAPIFKEVVEQASKFQLNDSAYYFFEEIDRIGHNDFIPNDQDILRTRVKTTGITEERFRIKSYLLRVFDVGGQRSERKKWIHCFEGVSVLVFVVAISEYDQNLYEDESVNRLTEAIQLFESLTTSKWFVTSSFVLLANKIDLFRKKLLTAPLKNYYPEYSGSADVTQGIRFMVKRFTRVYPVKGRRQLYTHATCATDTTQARVVISAMLDSVITATLAEVGLM